MSRAPTGGDSDSDEDMDKEYQIELLYHAADGVVQAERLKVKADSTWPEVKKFAQQRSGHADFALEDEDGGRLGAQTPLAWIRADQQARATWTRDDQPGEARRRHEKMAPRTAGTRLLRHQRGASSGSSDRQGARTSSLGLHTRSTTDGRRRRFRHSCRRPSRWKTRAHPRCALTTIQR